MPGNFAYSPSTNTVTVTGGTSGSPADFASFVAADRAGTLTLKAATPPALGIALATQIRPCEKLALLITFVLAGTNAGAGDTIDITGTDAWGNAQTESINVAAGNGTYVSAKRWRTITSFSCTGFNDGVGTVTVTQPQWGVIWNKGVNQYQLDCAATLQIGNGSTSTYFFTSREQLTWDISNLPSWGTCYAIIVKANASFVSGQILDAASKTGGRGSQFLIYTGGNGSLTWQITRDPFVGGNNIISLYGCAFGADGGWWIDVDPSNGNVYSCLMGSRAAMRTNNVDIANVMALDAADILALAVNSSINNVFGYITSILASFGGSPMVVTNSNITTTYGNMFNFLSNSYDGYVVDCIVNKWDISWGTNITKSLYRQYTLKLHVTDKHGNNIEGAIVSLKDREGIEIIPAPQNQTDANGKMAFAGEDSSTIDNAVTHTRYYYSGGTQSDYRGPWTLTITATGYQDYQDVITIDRKMDLEVAMLSVAASGGGFSPTNLGLVPLGIKQVAV